MWPFSVQCRVLQVSTVGYHAHLVRRGSDAQRRLLNDEALLVHIQGPARRNLWRLRGIDVAKSGARTEVAIADCTVQRSLAQVSPRWGRAFALFSGALMPALPSICCAPSINSIVQTA